MSDLLRANLHVLCETTIIHVLASIPEYKNNPEKLRKHLGLTPEVFQRELLKLEHMGFLSVEGNSIKTIKPSLHLQTQNPLSYRHHINWRQNVLNHLSKPKPSPEDLHVTAVFSASNQTMTKIQQKLVQLLVEVRELVSEEETEAEVSKKLLIDYYN